MVDLISYNVADFLCFVQFSSTLFNFLRCSFLPFIQYNKPIKTKEHFKKTYPIPKKVEKIFRVQVNKSEME